MLNFSMIKVTNNAFSNGKPFTIFIMQWVTVGQIDDNPIECWCSPKTTNVNKPTLVDRCNRKLVQVLKQLLTSRDREKYTCLCVRERSNEKLGCQQLSECFKVPPTT